MKRIFIDAGHGGTNIGAVGHAMRENDIVLEVALELGRLLEAAGLETMQTRTADTSVTNAQRPVRANNWQADLFVSIHVNAGGGFGAETIHSRIRPQDKATARGINDIFAREMGLRNRGVHIDLPPRVPAGPLSVFAGINMPAVLVELGFIDAPAGTPDVDMLRNRRKEMAAALAKGILAHFGINPEEKQPLQASAVRFDLKGKRVDVEGFLKEGRNFVMARPLLEALGYGVDWDNDAQTIVVR